jgi:hypothetical protein
MGSISITAATQVGGVVSVTGEYLGIAFGRYHDIDLYRAAPNSSGFSEGRPYLDSTSFQDSFIVPIPVWTIVDPTGCGGSYTVVLSDYDGFCVICRSRSGSALTSAAPPASRSICRR